MCAWAGGVLRRWSKSQAWMGERWEVVRHGCGGLGSRWEEGQERLGADLDRTRVPRMMLKTSYSSSSRLNGQPTFSTAIDVSPALLLAIISTAKPVLAVTARHHASQSEDTKPSVLHSSTTGDNIS